MSEDVRVGVFVCDCGSNIAGTVDVPAVVEYTKNLEHVALADQGRWSCSVDYLTRLQDLIREHNLNRVVIASCTPRTHEPLFKASVRETGLNPYLLEFVSIREQVSWVHMNEPDKATEKAKDLVRMGVAKAVLLEEGEEIRLPVGRDCLVIGGGISGMHAALNIAKQGFHAILVEKAPELGGLLARVSTIAHEHIHASAPELAQSMSERVKTHPLIDVHTTTEIETVAGYIGNYDITLRSLEDGQRQTVGVSTIIVATGMQEDIPSGLYAFGEDERVITQLMLEKRILSGNVDPFPANIVIINCVNSKNEQHGCCSVGCVVSVKNAIALKQLNPKSQVHILYRDLSMIDEQPSQVDAAKKAGVRFLRFADDDYPKLERDNGDLTVRMNDILLGKELTLDADLVVLTTAFCGDETVGQVKGHLKVSANQNNFFQEAHVKLGPLDFPTNGIFLAGCAKAPKHLKESIEEGIGAAMRASIPMQRGHIEAEGIVAGIDLSLCKSTCRLCSKKCPYAAIRLSDDGQPSVLKALCKGCGLCVADCPQEAITLVHYTDEQLIAQIEAALAENPDQKILGFVCHWCALGGVDMAGVSRLQYPTHARLIRVMCSARVPTRLVLRAFELGAAGVMVAGCEFPTCHYITGNYACEARMKRAKRQLAKKGFEPEKLWNIWCSAADGPKFANAMRDMVKALELD